MSQNWYIVPDGVVFPKDDICYKTEITYKKDISLKPNIPVRIDTNFSRNDNLFVIVGHDGVAINENKK